MGANATVPRHELFTSIMGMKTARYPGGRRFVTPDLVNERG